ncbi:MAG TPA: isochorismatase family cysteine hydrolase [Erysipelothrix sp.]
MKTLLCIVDVQEDFVRGALPGENAQARVKNMVARAKVAQARDEAIIFTQDTHDRETYMQTQEGKNLPIYHCIKGTKGWEIISELQEFVTDATVIEKSTFGSIPMMDVVEKKLNEGYKRIELFGICTDICVINTAVLLKNTFPEVEIAVNSQCSAGVSEKLHQNALDVMASFQIKII